MSKGLARLWLGCSVAPFLRLWIIQRIKPLKFCDLWHVYNIYITVIFCLDLFTVSVWWRRRIYNVDRRWLWCKMLCLRRHVKGITGLRNDGSWIRCISWSGNSNWDQVLLLLLKKGMKMAKAPTSGTTEINTQKSNMIIYRSPSFQRMLTINPSQLVKNNKTPR